MSAEIVDLGRLRLKHQLSLSVALLNAAGASINLDEALKPPAPDTDRDFIGRLVQSALEFMDQGELISAAKRLESAASALRRFETAPRERAERNRKRRERAAKKRTTGGAK
jgi:hypothetical protein